MRRVAVPALMLIPLFSVMADPEPLDLSADLGASMTLSSGMSGLEGYSIPLESNKEFLGFAAKNSFFEAVTQLSMNNDGKYGADIANFTNSKHFFNNYFYIDQGYTTLHFKPLDLQVGRYAQKDEFDSPYSLFLNSMGHSALGMRLRYEDDFFAYESKWIDLNDRSDFGKPDNTPPAWQWVWDGTQYVREGTGFPDRGANLKTFLFKFGDVHVGLQDAAVYTGRSFDAEYFVSPLPEYFTQYVKTTAGRPWSTGSNENNLIGFFVTATKPEYDWGVQVLIDDFSLHFLFPDQVPNNPWKAAWSLGGHLSTVWGRFGLFTAGALKYTFEPITTGVGNDTTSAYGYAYYPDVEYMIDGKPRTIGITDNAVGYLYGENNLALRATYDRDLGRGLGLLTSLELVVAGANSPANPWQDATKSNNVGTHWLDDAVLQRSIVWGGALTWRYQDWGFSGGWSLGWVGNQLMADLPTGTASSADQPGPSGGSGNSALDTLVKIFKPSSSGYTIANLTFGATYHFDISGAQQAPRQQ